MKKLSLLFSLLIISGDGIASANLITERLERKVKMMEMRKSATMLSNMTSTQIEKTIKEIDRLMGEKNILEDQKARLQDVQRILTSKLSPSTLTSASTPSEKSATVEIKELVGEIALLSNQYRNKGAAERAAETERRLIILLKRGDLTEDQQRDVNEMKEELEDVKSLIPKAKL